MAQRTKKHILLSSIVVFIIITGVFLVINNYETKTVLAAPVGISCTGDSITPTAVTESSITSSDDITFSGSGWCEIDEPISAASVLVSTGVTLTHAAEDADGINITTTGDFTIQSGAYINVDERGCLGDNTQANGRGPGDDNICVVGGPGAGEGAVGDTAASGAGYGGNGGNGNGGGGLKIGGTAYSNTTTDTSFINPNLFGASGGNGNDNSNSTGGNGGGLILLNIGGIFSNAGNISANGGVGLSSYLYRAGGGGSGGAINITATKIIGDGTYISNGGDGLDVNSDSGAGGGGRIALSYTDDTTKTFTSSDFSVDGGTAYGSAISGDTGTVSVIDSDSGIYNIFHGFTYSGDYLVTSWLVDSSAINQYCYSTDATPSISATDISLSGSLDCTDSVVTEFDLAATNSLTMDGFTFDLAAENILTFDNAAPVSVINSSIINSNINWTNLTSLDIDATSVINANEKGCSIDTAQANGSAPDDSNSCVFGGTGSGLGSGGDTGASGAGYGGAGGNGGGYGGLKIGGDLYSASTDTSFINPTLFGASGGNGDAGSSSYGGVGGGLVILEVSGTFNHEGNITCNGEEGHGIGTYEAGGGGSGGAINVTANKITGAGTFVAEGGDGVSRNANADSGGGGGGAIAIRYTDDTTKTFTSSDFSVTGGTAYDTAVSGDTGRVYVEDTDSNNVNIFHGFAYSDTDFSENSWTIDSSATGQVCEPNLSTSATPSITANYLTLGGTLSCDQELDTFDYSATSDFNVNDDTIISLNYKGNTMDWNIPASDDQTINNATITVGAEGNFTIDDAVSLDLNGSTINSNINWTNLTGLDLDATSTINANEKGCVDLNSDANGREPNDSNICETGNTRAGTGTTGDGGVGGGAHGGDGGSGNSTSGGTAYDALMNPALFGSSGGTANDGYNSTGGAGGGLIILGIDGTFNYEGSLSANGGQGLTDYSYRAGGGGSGGTINIITDYVYGSSGTISAQGGAGADVSYDGGGGGGGRIFLESIDYSSFLSTWTAENTTTGGTATGSASAGSTGTLYLLAYSVPTQPSLSSPLTNSYNNNPDSLTLTSSAFSDNGSGHSTSDWKIVASTDSCTDSAVHESLDDVANLESYTVPAETLSYNTTYKACVRHTNLVGDSDWSDPITFTTSYNYSSETQNWTFNIPSEYSYNSSDITIDSSKAYLTDQGGGTYTAAGMAGYGYRRPITITNSGSELTNYQVQLTVSYDSDMQADFDDLRFTNSDGLTDIDYWIEDYTASTSATVWVKVPTLTAAGDTTIYMYYGNVSVATASSKENTMTNDYSSDSGLLGQWNFDEGSGTSVADSSGQEHDGTITWDGTAAWYGSDNFFSAGDSIDLDGGGVDRVDTDIQINTNLGDDFTLETWAIIDDVGDGWGWFFGESSGTFLFGKQSGTNKLYYNMNGIGSNSNIGTYTTGAWHHFVLSHDKSEANAFKIYIDGTLVGTYNEQSASNTSTGNVRFGRRGGGEVLDGKLDEIRVYNRYMTEEEVAAHSEHRKYATSSPSSVIGTEQGVSYDNIKITSSINPTFNNLLTFSETLGSGNEGDVYYQLSNDGVNWYYLDSSNQTWSSATEDSIHKNTVAEINSYLPKFVDDIGTGDFYIKAFLVSNGFQAVELDNLTLTYNAKPTTPSMSFDDDTRNPALSGSVFDGLGSHADSDWKITTDDACSNVVWSKDDDAINKTSITVNDTNGSFAGILLGKNKLAPETTYYACVRYNNSDWSSPISQLTQANVVPATPTNSSPADSSSDQSLTPSFNAGAYSESEGDSHAKSTWYLYASSDCSGDSVWSSVDDSSHKEAISLADGSLIGTHVGQSTLKSHTTYSWKVRYTDEYNGVSDYSTCTSFSTTNNSPQLDSSISDQDLTEDTDVTGAIDLDTYISDSDWNDQGNLNCSIVDDLDLSLGSLTLNPDHTVDFVLTENANGSDTIQFNCSDSVNNVDTNIITVNISPVNDSPVFSGSLSVPAWDEDSSQSAVFDLDDYFSDVDTGDSCTYTLVDDPSPNIDVDINGEGVVSFTPVSDWNGEETAQFKCTDTGLATTDSNSLILTINNVNDAPIANAGSDQDISEEEVVILDSSSSSDIDDDSLTAVWTEISDSGDGCSLSGNQVITLNKESNYSCIFSLTVNDGQVDSVEDTVVINVTADNDAPTMGALADIQVDEEDVLVIAVSAADVDSPSLTLSTSSLPIGAIFTDNEDKTGNMQWTPNSEQSGEYTINFSVSDGTNTASQQVIITVNDTIQEEPENPEEPGEPEEPENPEEPGEPEEPEEDEQPLNSIDDIGLITGTAKGPAIITVYDNDQNELCSAQAWNEGGVQPFTIRLLDEYYIAAVKNKTGTTIHLYDLNCQIVEKKRLSPKLHPREMVIRNFLGKARSQEIAITSRRGSSIYGKIFRYNPNTDTWYLLKQKRFRPVPTGYNLKKTKHGNVLIQKDGETLHKWKI